MSPDEIRAYAARHGLSLGDDAMIGQLATVAETVAATGRAIPRSANPTLEPAATFTVHLPARFREQDQ